MKFRIIFLALVVFSCSIGPSNTRSGSNDTKNEIAYEKQIKEYKFRLTPVSSENLMAINYKNQTITEDEKTQIKKEYLDYWCFKLEIVVDGFKQEICEYYDKTDNKADYDALLNYYLFEMQNDLKIVSTDGNEALCNVYFFERNYNITKSNRFIIGFKKPLKENDATLTYDNRYLNIGKVNFKINKKDFLS